MEQETGNERVAFQLTEGRVEIGVDDLDNIHQVLLAFLRDPDKQFLSTYAEFQKPLVTELEKVQARLDGDGTLRLGNWMLQERSGVLVLARYPARSPGPTYVFLASVLRQDGAWKIVRFGHERMSGR